MPPQLKLNESQKLELERRIHRSASFQRVFRGPDGEEVLDEIKKICSFDKDTFDADPYIHSYKAGKRSIAVFIINCIESDVEKAREMLKESEKQNAGTEKE